MPDYRNPQHLNRYSYVINNPLRYTDPSGHRMTPCGEDGSQCGGSGSGTGSNGGSNGSNGGGGGGGSGSGGGGNSNGGGSTTTPAPTSPSPVPQPAPDFDGNSECPDWNVCVTGVSGTSIYEYWQANNNILNAYDTWTTATAIGSIVSGIGSYIAYSVSQGGPIFTPQFIALVTGIALVEPTAIGEFLLVTGVVLGASSFALDQAAQNLQDINNAIVDSGAMNTGGTIIASPTQVTIVTSAGSTTVPSFLVGQVALDSWASGNPNLVSP